MAFIGKEFQVKEKIKQHQEVIDFLRANENPNDTQRHATALKTIARRTLEIEKLRSTI